MFDVRTFTSFVSNDSDKKSSSYLIADWIIKCENEDSDYEGVQQAFWALFFPMDSYHISKHLCSNL